ncbi:MAG: hypothetical protein EB127_12200 [Alphaproteobacteria bacterium]|nr:hypothetical protein [Alphaproteobacteria bacterium]
MSKETFEDPPKYFIYFGMIDLINFFKGPDSVAQAVYSLTSKGGIDCSADEIKQYYQKNRQEILANMRNEIKNDFATNYTFYADPELKTLAEHRLLNNGHEGKLYIVSTGNVDPIKQACEEAISTDKPAYCAINSGNHWAALAIVPSQNGVMRVVYQNSVGGEAGEIENQKIGEAGLADIIEHAMEGGANLEFINVAAQVQQNETQQLNACGAFTIEALDIISKNSGIIQKSSEFDKHNIEWLLASEITDHATSNNLESNSYRMKQAKELDDIYHKINIASAFDQAISTPENPIGETNITIDGQNYKVNLYVISEGEIAVTLTDSSDPSGKLIDLEKSPELQKRLAPLMPLPEDCIKFASVAPKPDKWKSSAFSSIDETQPPPPPPTWRPYKLGPGPSR